MRAAPPTFPKRSPDHHTTSMRYSHRHLLPDTVPHSAPRTQPGPALALRVLVLLLIVLLLIFVGLMHMTGGYHVGGPVLGSILLIGLGAAHYGR
jgi:hypothetical protein